MVGLLKGWEGQSRIPGCTWDALLLALDIQEYGYRPVFLIPYAWGVSAISGDIWIFAFTGAVGTLFVGVVLGGLSEACPECCVPLSTDHSVLLVIDDSSGDFGRVHCLFFFRCGMARGIPLFWSLLGSVPKELPDADA